MIRVCEPSLSELERKYLREALENNWLSSIAPPVAHFEDDAFTAAWVAELVERVFVVDWPRNRTLEGSNITRIRTLEEAEGVLREKRRE